MPNSASAIPPGPAYAREGETVALSDHNIRSAVLFTLNKGSAIQEHFG